MKFTVNTREFTEALEKALKFTAAKSPVQCLENVKISVSGGNCRLSATNLEQYITVRADAESEGDITIMLPETKTLAKGMKYYTGEKTVFECGGDRVNITCGGKKAVHQLLDAALFPNTPVLKDEINNSFVYTSQKLKERFNAVRYAASVTQVRPVLTGVYFKDDLMVTTDGYRIAFNRDRELNIAQPFVVPVHAVKLAAEALDGDITAANDSNHIEFRNADITVTSRLLDGEYMRYDDYYSNRGDKVIKVDRKDFTDSLKYLKTFIPSRGAANMRIHWYGGRIGLRREKSVYESEIRADNPTSLDIEIAFDADYMIEALSQFSGEVSVYVRNELSLIILASEGDEANTAAVLPKRITDKLFDTTA